MIRKALGRAADHGVAWARAGEDWLLGSRKATYGVSVVRILFGLTALWFLAANWSNRHYLWGDAGQWMSPLARNGGFEWPFTFFAGGGSEFGLTAKLVLLVGLLVAFVVGWRTRIIAPIVLVLWVSLIESNPVYGDQSDNIARILLFYLCFADLSGRWSIDERRRRRKAKRIHPNVATLGTLFHNLAVLAVGAQICIIYIASGLYKAQGETWQEGTAVYYPLQVSHYQPWPELNDILGSNPLGVLAVSYFSVFIQLFFPLMLLRRATRIVALLGVSAMHLGIAVAMGLPFFSLFIMAGDQIFIRDSTYVGIAGVARRKWREWRGQRLIREPDEGADVQSNDVPSGANSEKPQVSAGAG